MEQSTPTPIAKIAITTTERETVREGAVIGGYHLGETLARGAFGTVWRAQRVADGRHVAIKFLHAFLCESREAIARLEREAEAISAIAHPNVVGVHGYGRLGDGRPYIVMELLEGNSVYAQLQKDGPFSPARTLEVLDGICAGLMATHAVGIIHRDIKASNAFLVPDGDGVRAVLLDYGLAKILESDGPDLTSSRATLGTPSAMSPEQIRSEPVTVRSDVYALGALAFHMLTGEPAFSSVSKPTIFYMHLHGKRPRPSTRGDVSPAYDAVVTKAMARVPANRHASAMAFLADFAIAVNHERRKPAPRPSTAPLAPSTRMLGVYLDVDASLEVLADPSDELLDEIEAIEAIAEPILGSAGLDFAASRGSSVLFAKVVSARAELEERSNLMALLAAISRAIELRPMRSESISVRLAADVVVGGVGDARAVQLLLEAVTRLVRSPEAQGGTKKGILGTSRFLADLGPGLDAAEESCRVATDSEL